MNQSVPGEYTEVTKGIKVSVKPQFVRDRSDLPNSIYVFSYSVTLENEGTEIVQLINRHWIVNSGDRQYADVKGEGVIGEQPVLEPGVSFQYTSWTVIDEPSGSMHGTYTFRSETGDFFDVTIPEFHLVYIDPGSLH